MSQITIPRRRAQSCHDMANAFNEISTLIIVSIWTVIVFASWVMIMLTLGIAVTSCATIAECNPTFSATPSRIDASSVQIDHIQIGVRCRF